MKNEESVVAIYARVSTEEQAEHGYSIDAQLDTLRQFCNMYGKTIFREYVDRGVSGKSIKGRFELQRLIADAKKGQFNEVLVWKINRISRRNIDLLKIVEELNNHDVVFRSFSENFETETPMGKFALQMLGAVGELERNTIVDNVKMGMKQRARMGYWNGGVVLGYRSIKVGADTFKNQDTKLEIVPEEAAIIRVIFDLYNSGKGLKAIANEINHKGYKTKKGNSFSTSAIKEIITNPVYIGKIRYNRFEDWSEKRRKGKSNEVILSDGNHEPIITWEVWEKAQILQESKSKVSKRKFDGKYILTGLIQCPQCGASMVASRTTNKLKDGSKKIIRYYSCGAFRSKGSAVCSANSVRADYAEGYVFERIKQVLINKEVLSDIVDTINDRKLNRVEPLQQELASLNNKIDSIKANQRKYFNLYEDDTMDEELFRSRLQDLDKELDLIHNRKSEIELELGDDQSQLVALEDVRERLEQLEHIINNASTEQIKTLLHLVIERITLDENKKIKAIQMNFTEQTQQHFLGTAPSDEQSEGASSVFERKSNHMVGFRIEI